MDERMGRFRCEVERHFGGRPGRGARYPEVLQAEAVSIVQKELARGASLAEVSRRLGIGPATLGRWLESPPSGSADLRPVELIEAEQASDDPSGTDGHLVLVTAGGHRVEGLHLDEVALLLEALG